MTENNPKVKVIFPALMLVSSIYYPFFFTAGIVLGYLGSKLYCKIFRIDENSSNRIFVDFGKWTVHIHHWILGIIFLAVAWIVDRGFLSAFVTGGVIGVIVHDIYDFSDWHKVFFRNDIAGKKLAN